jgi:hypothetical protein
MNTSRESPLTASTRRTFLAGTVGTLGLLAASGRARAGYSPDVVAGVPYLPQRQYPTMGTDDANPTAVVYLNLSDPAAQDFVQGNLEDIVETYVLPGLLNVELRFLAYDPDAPSRELDGGEDNLALSSRTAYGVWDLEPGNFWQFLEFVFWNFTTRAYSVAGLESVCRRGGVRNYVKVPSNAADGRWDGMVRAATEEARRYNLRAPYVPTLRFLRDYKDGRAWHIVDWVAARLDRVDEGGVSRRTLLPGTKYSTPMYVIDSGRSGPTALVVGGIHGDEAAGYTTAERIATLRPTGGRLIVIPRANRPAIATSSRYTSDGDLNRQFPTGSTPTSTLARAIWDVVETYDPDVVVDLHTARGIYKYDNSVGQAIFPTPAGATVGADACELVNDLLIDDAPYPSYYDFDRGNLLSGARPMLVHKCYGDRRLPAYLVETTRKGTDFSDRLAWEYTAAVNLLDAHGMFVC